MEEIPILVVSLFAALVVGFVWRAKRRTNDVSIIMWIGFASMLISMPFTPTDKDGYLNFLWTTPYLLCGLVGAGLGVGLERLRCREQ